MQRAGVRAEDDVGAFGRCGHVGGMRAISIWPSVNRQTTCCSWPSDSTTVTVAGIPLPALPRRSARAARRARRRRRSDGRPRRPPHPAARAPRPARGSRGAPGSPMTVPVTVFIGGLPMKPRRTGSRAVVDLLRRADLLEATAVEDRDACRHRHRLDLVVGDVDDRRLEPALQLDELGAGLRRAAWRRGSRAARPSGTLRAGARSRARARRAGADRPTAARACASSSSSSPSVSRRFEHELAIVRRLEMLRVRSGNSMFRRTVMCG